ncbi:MAG: hypothetical protein WB493_08685 [Anaeromyxobacteraceae bacterium]
MAETQKSKNAKNATKVEGFLRESVEVAQARLEVLEAEAQKLLHEVQTRFQKVSGKDWAEVKERLEHLREVGRERAEEWKDKAQEFRVDAAERLETLQEKALRFLGVATREEVAELSREINKILKRLDERKRKAARPAKKPIAQA